MTEHLAVNHLEALLENLSEGVIFVDKNGIVVRMNVEALRIHGIKSHNDMIAEASKYKSTVNLRNLSGKVIPFENWPTNRLARGEKFRNLEIEVNHIHNSTRNWIGRFSSVPIIAENGEFLFGVITVSDITKEKKLELKLQESQDYFEKMVDTSPAMLWITQADGSCSYLSKQWYEFTGQTPATGLGFGWLDATHPDDRENSARIFTEAVEKQKPFAVDYRLKRKDGEYRWSIDAGNPRFNSDGVFLGFVGTVIDISARKKAEEELRKSQQELKSYCEAMPQMAFTSAPNGDILYYNTRHFEYFGVDSGEHENWGWRDSSKPAVHPNDMQRTVETWTHALKTGSPYQIEYRLRRWDGQYRWHLGRAVPTRDEFGNITRWYGTNTDIQEQKVLQEALVESEAKFRTITEALPQMIWSTLPNGYHDYFNKRWYEFTGVEQGSSEGQEGWNKLFHPDDRERAWKVWRNSLSTGENYQIEYRLKFHTGEYRWTLGRALPVKNQNGEIIRWLGTCTDIHDIKITEAKLAEAVRARDEFLSIASHELKTPLTSLKLQAQLHARAINKNDPSAYSKERVDNIVQQTDKQIKKLNRLVDDMLDVSRIRSGKLNIKIERFDMSALVNDVVERMSHQFENAKSPTPTISCSENTEGNWDRLRTEQVITNLLTNAIRYGQGKPIEVRVDATDFTIRIVVKDRGMGIAPHALEKIFERFERAIDANEVSGLGLGLFITKQIVIAHGGTVWVESELGKGSTFTVELPKTIERESSSFLKKSKPGANLLQTV